MPSTGARGTARGGPLSTDPFDPSYRCSVGSLDRGDELAGTATNLRAIVIVEHDGPWGQAVPRDSRLPADVISHLSGHRAVRLLFGRRHLRHHRGAPHRVLLAFPSRRLLLSRTYVEPEELLDVDLEALARGVLPDWEPWRGPVYGVCTHGRHDLCCAVRGRPVAKAFTDLRPEQTWEISHIGGDRYAANVLVLPEGLYYGRVAPGGVEALAVRHEEGRLDLDHLRGRTTYPMPVQYAEIALRRHLDEDRLDAIRLIRRDGPTSVFDHDGREWSVTVSRRTEDEARLTCSATRLNPVPVFDVVALDPTNG